MDKIDIAILREMAQEQEMLPAKVGLRSSYRQIAKNVGISAGTIGNRIRKMYLSGLVSGSSVFVNPFALGLKGGAYALDVSPNVRKIDALERLKAIENILTIHNFRGSMIGFQFVFEDQDSLEELTRRFQDICGTNTGSLTHVEYPSCPISLSDRDWKLIMLLSEEGFHSYSQLSKRLKVSVRTLVRRLSILRSEGAILSIPTLNYRAIRDGLGADLVVGFTSPETKAATERKIFPYVSDYLIFVGIGLDYVVYNLIVPNINVVSELSTRIPNIEGVTAVRAELVDEHFDVTRNMLFFLKRKIPAHSVASSSMSSESPTPLVGK